MFEGLLSGEEKPSQVDALLKLLDLDDIELKTELEMPQVRTFVITEYFKQRTKDSNKSGIDCLSEALKVYLQLKVSYKRKGRNEIIKGVTELKEFAKEEQLIRSGKD